MTFEPIFDEARLRASLLTPQTETAGEKTIGGRLIASVRDSLSGKAQTGAEAQERAASNDMFAELAADTFAMMPGVRWAKAGAVRAAFMINPTAGLEENTKQFGLNFAEGVALHHVGKYGAKVMYAPPGVSRSLGAESVGLFKLGFGMGGIKAAFDENTWVDKDGNVQVANGLLSVAKGGTIGGALGVPAGLVGNRVARFGIAHLGNSGINPRAMSIGLGMAAGYPAGAVFGGVDAAMRGEGVASVFKTAHEGGLVGMATGGLTGALMPHEAALQMRRGTKFGSAADDGVIPKERVVTSEPEAVIGAADDRLPADRLGRKLPADHPPVSPELLERMTIPQRTNLAANFQRLGNWKAGTIEIKTAAPTADSIAKSSQTFGDFAAGAISSKTEPARIYSLRGLEIVIPESYGKDLDRIYHLRIARDRGMAPGASKLQLANAEIAAKALKDDPLQFRAHPADLVAIDQLPDRTLVKRIEIWDALNPEDAWHRKTYKSDFLSAATASDNGTIRYYKPRLTSDLTRTTHHEWGHLLRFKAQRDGDAFDIAATLEKNAHADRSKDGYSVSEYSKRNFDENWAEHSAELTQPDPTGFFITTQEAPLRTAFTGRALGRALAFVPPNKRSPYHTEIATRVAYIDEQVMPRAQKLLEGYLTRGTGDEQVSAAKLLREIGTREHFEMLKDVARKSNNDTVRDAAFNASREMAFYGRENWKGYSRTEGTATKDTFVDYLIEMSSPHSRSRTAALEYLQAQPGDRAQGYYNLLTAEQSKQPMVGLLKAMQMVPDQEGKLQAYSIARRLIGADKDTQFKYSLTILQTVPGLRHQALEALMHLDLPKTEPMLRMIVKRPTSSLHDQAKAGLERLETQRQIETLEARAKFNQDSTTREQAIAALGATGDRSALKPLLSRFGYAKEPADRAAAYQAITENFNRQIVKDEIHTLIREDARWRSVLQPILDGRPVGLVVDRRS